MLDQTHKGKNMYNGERIAFIKAGSFSNTNEKLLHIMKKEFPTYKIDIIDLWADLISRKDLINLLFCFKEYGAEILVGRKRLRDCLARTTYFFNKVRNQIVDRLEKQNYTFTFQTQSLFDASIPGIPHFVYTDHTHLANLYYPIFDEKQLFTDSWVALEKSIYHNASLNFTMSSNISKSIIEQYSCDPEKVITVYCGSNVEVPTNVELYDQRYSRMNILFVGVDWERKGGPQLLEAFKSVLQICPQAQLTVVGCSPKLDVPNCHIVGRVPLSEVSTYYKNASVFCLPTGREPFGIVFIEAFFYKLPIISTNLGALPEIVSNGENGYLVDYNNTQQLTERLIELISNPNKCKTFGEKGYYSTRERYTWEKTGQRIKKNINTFLDKIAI